MNHGEHKPHAKTRRREETQAEPRRHGGHGEKHVRRKKTQKRTTLLQIGKSAKHDSARMRPQPRNSFRGQTWRMESAGNSFRGALRMLALFCFLFPVPCSLTGCNPTPAAPPNTQTKAAQQGETATEYTARARDFMSKRLFRQAAESFEKAVALSPNDADLLMEWIGARQSAGDERQTEELARRAVGLAPDNPKALVYLGSYLAKLSANPEKRKEAKPLLEKAAQLAPTMPIPRIELGQLQKRDGDFRGAQKTLTEAWKLLHNGLRSLRHLETMDVLEARRSETAYALALCARALNQPAEAKTWFARFREIDARIEKRTALTPKVQTTQPDLNALLELAKLDIDNGGAEEAVPLVKRAMQIAPNDGRIQALVNILQTMPAE
jgi:Flp pilus assembly protein TadD